MANLHNSQGVLTSKLFGFYCTTNKKITNKNYSGCHNELAFGLYIDINL